MSLQGNLGVMPRGLWAQGAIVDMDFVNDRYLLGGQVYNGDQVYRAPGLSVSTPAGYVETAAGVLVPTTAGKFRRSDKGLLVEEARTNVLRWSQDISNAVYTKGTGGSVAANDAQGPDGTLTADTYTLGSATSSFGYLAQTVSGNAALTWTVSVWLRVKTGTRTARLRISDATTTTLTGPVETVTTTWQRFKFTVAAAALTNTGQVGAAMVGQTAGDLYEVWGWQLEQAGTVSSHAPTTSGAAARAADANTYAYAWPGQGSIFANWIYNGLDSRVLWLDAAAGGQYDNNVTIQPRATNAVRLGFKVAAVGPETTSSGLATGGVARAASSLDASNFRAALNGAQAFAAVSGGTPTGINTARIGYHRDGIYLNSYIRRIRIFPTAMNDAELQALTA